MNKWLPKFIGILLISLICCSCLLSNPAPSEAQSSPSPAPTASPAASTVQLPPLPYAYNALEPYIDAQTMQIHHDKHHAAYVNNLNEALKQYPDLQKRSISDLVSNLSSVPEAIRTTVQNNGGGHINHTMFWEIMAPNAGGQPSGELGRAITSRFGSFDAFKTQFNEAGSKRFGSGWAWLVMNPQGQLQITSTANQDSPLMQGLYPIMGNDVWEHAYYLKYQNRRGEYLNNWWNVVNWSECDRRYSAARQMMTR